MKTLFAGAAAHDSRACGTELPSGVSTWAPAGGVGGGGWGEGETPQERFKLGLTCLPRCSGDPLLWLQAGAPNFLK